MTRNEAMQRVRMFDTLRALGFTQDEAESLRRISMTLHRWHELECGTDGGCIERNEQDGNRPYWRSSHVNHHSYSPIPDRETGARKRLAKILAARNERFPEYKAGQLQVNAYVQTDPRGAALYILRPGDVPAGADVSAYYTRGICIY